MRKPADPVECEVFRALMNAGLKFTMEPHRTKNLDFYLPDYDLYIEVCAYYTPRKIEQCSRADNVILIQGINAACALHHIFGINSMNVSIQK